MVSTFISLLDIQSWWEIPCIAHFCSLFSSAFNLPDIDIEDLESALLTDGTDENVGLIPELIVHLLKGCNKVRKFRDKITTSNYQMFLRRFLRHQCRLLKIENYFDTDIDFQSLPIRNKLLILHSLCHFRLDSKDVQDILNNLESDSLRVEPLGYDSKNSGYWYFYGTRLYREDIKSNGKTTIWQVICFTEEDWQNLASKFKDSSSPKERALYNILNENFLPKLPQLFREREKLRRRKLLQVRNSARIRNHLEDKQRQLDEKAKSDLAEKQQIEIEQATAIANKYKSGRIRRRSQSTSTGSGISTYASSFCAALSSDSTEFLIQREKFCLSTEEDDEDENLLKLSTPSPPPPLIEDNKCENGIIKSKDNNKNETLLETETKTLLPSSSASKIKRKRQTKQKNTTRKRLTKDKSNSLQQQEEEQQDKDLNSVELSDDKYNENKSELNKLKEGEEDKENYRLIDSDSSENCSSIKSSSSSLSTTTSKNRNHKRFIEPSVNINIDMAPTTNMKLPGRQTNNSLSSLSGNIFIPPAIFGNSSSSSSSQPSSNTAAQHHQQQQSKNIEIPSEKDIGSGSSSKTKEKEKITATMIASTSSSSSNSADSSHPQQKKKKTKSSGISNQRNLPPNIPFLSFTETDEVLQIGMHKVLVSVKNHRDAWPFVDPVEEDIAPRYYSIIRRPMDLLKMEEKLDNGEYRKFSEFRNDFKLIVNNCRLYNGQNNEYTDMVNNLQEAFDKATKKYFDHYSSDEEGNSCYPDLKTTVFREKHFNKNNPTKSSSLSTSTSSSSITALAAVATCTNQQKDSNMKSKGSNKSGGNKQNEKIVSEIHNTSNTNNKHDKQCNDKNDDSKGGNKRKRKDKDKRRKKKMKLNSAKSKSYEDNSTDEEDDEGEEGREEQRNNGIGGKRIIKQEQQDEEKDDVEVDEYNETDDDSENEKDSEIKRKHHREQEVSSVPSKKSKQQKSSSSSLLSSNKTGKKQKNQTQPSSKGRPNSKKSQENKSENKNSTSGGKKQNSKLKKDNAKSSKKGSTKIEVHPEAEDISSDEDIVEVVSDNDDHVDENSGKIESNNKRGKRSSMNTKKIKKLSSTNTNTSKNSSNKVKKEKENQNMKSKSNSNKETNNSSGKKDLSSSSSSSQPKDNKSRSASTSSKNKKKNKSSNKKNGVTQRKRKQQHIKRIVNDDDEKEEDEEEIDNNTVKIDNNENDDVDSLSRCSSPLYKVDLHKKYAQSASMNFEDELLYSSIENNKKHSNSANQNIKNTKNNDHRPLYRQKENSDHGNEDNMLMSVSSQSSMSSRSTSPVAKQLSPPSPILVCNKIERKESKKKKTATMSATKKSNKKNEMKKNKKKSVTATKTESPSPPNSPSPVNKSLDSLDENNQKEIPLFLDKYDLIKQRRSRNATSATTEEKWNQIVKEAEKIKDTKKNSKANNNISGTTLTASKEKNQKLKETIEKLKVKNAKSKESAVLIDQIFGVKPPTHEIRDEQAILQKLRETCLDGNSATTLSTTKTHKSPDATVVPSATTVSPCNANSATGNVSAGNKRSTSTERQRQQRKESSSSKSKNKSPSGKKKERNHHHRHHHEKSRDSTGKKSPRKSTSGSPLKKNSSTKENQSIKDTNMEALELETEQTLKDINRWLENAPRFSEFGSASSSPSRFNILDDFVTSKIDPSDCSKAPVVPVPGPVPMPIASTTKDSISPTSLMPNDTFDEFGAVSTNTLLDCNKKDGMISSLITAANVVNSENPNHLAVQSSSVASNTSSVSQHPSQNSTSVKMNTNTTQLLPHPPPPPPHIKSQQQKEAKRKSLKEKLQAVASGHKRKDHPLRTIDRLQPGKLKGNLLSNTHHHNNKPSDEVFPLGASAKIKEVKNSLVVKTDETAPKLSLGSVLNTEGFGLGQLHSFETDSASSSSLRITEVISGEKSSTTTTDKKDEGGQSTSSTSERAESSSNLVEGSSTNRNNLCLPAEKKNDQEKEKPSSTPNLSAWFKAFGGPKIAKKLEEAEKKNENLSTEAETHQNSSNGSDNHNSNLENTSTEDIANASLSSTSGMGIMSNTFDTLKSPPTTSNIMENFPLPAPRTRKASTGSTISERSSFSQDPDSPRVGIDDRFGGYPGPYASPIGASPIMVSPKQDEIGKPTSPYPLNGAIKVGFYQDTTTKSSPEKSCSPRELPSPAAYPQYSQHVYSSVSSPTIGNDMGATGTTSYGASCYSNSNNNSGSTASDGSQATTAPAAATTVYPSASSATLYEQYKQPHSHESDYNSSMSPSTNPNSPYQQSQNSPYQQHQNSPYHQPQNSPYHQAQNSPFQQANSTPSPATQGASPMIPVTKSPVPSHQQQQLSPQQGPHSPYQQSMNSPYQQPNNSPYNQQQNASSPYHNQSPPQIQQQVNMNFSQTTPKHQTTPVNSPQQPPDSPFSSTESPQYQIHDSPQFQQQSDQQTVYESEIGKDSVVAKSVSIGNKMQQNSSEWSTGTTLTELSPMVPPQQQQPIHDSSNATALQYHQNYPQYPIANKNNNNSSIIQHQQQRQQDSGQVGDAGIKRMATQSNESNILGLSGYSNSSTDSQPPPNKQQKCDDSEKAFDSTLNKHQQMFDSFLGSMGGGSKGSLGFARPPLDISTSKAFEMFNRAATYGLSKEFQQNNLLSSAGNKMDGTGVLNNMQTQQAVSQPQQIAKVPNNSQIGGGKSILNSSYNQEQMMHQHQQPLEDPTKQLQQSSLFDPKLGNQVNTYSSTNSNDLVVPSLRPDQQHLSDANRNQVLNIDYKQTYNNPVTAMLDPLRNLNHPLSMMDENMLNLQSVPTAGYYDKNLPPAAHAYNKTLVAQQNYHHQNVSPYDARDPQNSVVPTANYIPSSVASNTNAANIPQHQQPISDGIEQKPSKRGRKKKNTTPTSVAVDTSSAASNQARNSMMTGTPTGQQSSVPPQTLPPNVAAAAPPNATVPAQSIHDQQQQGFQLYAGLKTAVANSTSVTTDSSAISLKSATTAPSMVPGSAFNFGPSPTGLGLSPAGIYGDQTGYLDEFRSAHNPYYPLPTGHRPEMNNEKSPNAPPPPGPPTPSTYHQFLTHSTSRTSYPFMNSPQLDPNSPIYQQYIQRQEELRARMMLNQGLLGPGPAPGYPQPGYRPPIGMPKHYDMNRQWY